MELKRYLHLFWRRWPVLLACVVIGAAVGWSTVPRGNSYTASSVIYVGGRSLQQQQSQLYVEPGLVLVVETYAEMIPSPAFARLALTGSGIDRSPDAVAAGTTAKVLANTTLISVSVTDSNPVVAQRLVNTLSDSFARLASGDSSGAQPIPGSLPAEPAYVFQYSGPGSLVPRHTSRYIILGAIFGLIIAILAALLVDYLDTTVRSTESIERRVGLPVLAVIPVASTRHRPSPRTLRRSAFSSGSEDV